MMFYYQNERSTGTEQYYTPRDVAENLTKKMLEFAEKDQVWLEPAGGTGSFIDSMLKNGIKNIESFDIEPLHPMVKTTKNFLKEDISNLSNVITLTNPPFGRANKLSVPFFNKCAAVSSKIGFIVPKSWRKWTVINRLDNRFHLVHDQELNIDFNYDDECEDKKGRLSTVFQIWEKRDTPRKKVVIEDRKYISVSDPKYADISITTRGRGCGNVKTDFKRVPNTTQTFLKLQQQWVLDAIKSIDFSEFYNNVAFIESLTIQEIMHALNEYHDSFKMLDHPINLCKTRHRMLFSCIESQDMNV